MQEYKESLKTKAEELVLKGFPETIVKLNDLLESPQFRNRKLNDVYQDLNIPIPDPIVVHSNSDFPPAKRVKTENNACDGTKVMAFATGTIESNKSILNLVEIVKPQVVKLVEDSNLVSILHKHKK